MQKIREQVLLRRDKVYQDNEGEVRKRWHFEDAVSFSSYSTLFVFSLSHNFPSVSHSIVFLWKLETLKGTTTILFSWHWILVV